MVKKVVLKIHYQTGFGASVCVTGNLPELGQWRVSDACRMLGYEDGAWSVELRPGVDVRQLEYKYVVLGLDGFMQIESGDPRVVSLDGLPDGLTVVQDFWKYAQSPDVSPHLRSAALTDVIFARKKPSASSAKTIGNGSAAAPAAAAGGSVTVRLVVNAVLVPPESSVRVSGNAAVLGAWNTAASPVMQDSLFPIWQVTLNVPRDQFPLQYKYVVCDAAGNAQTWEHGENHYVDAQAGIDGLVRVDVPFRTNYEWRGAGVAAPIFALRSKEGLGVGEFNDLKHLADWAAQSGLKLIQILPINDTSVRDTWHDSYPYSSLSVYALHPMYIHLNALTTDPAILKEITERQAALNGLPKIDYEAVVSFKKATLRKIFASVKSKFAEAADFKQWLQGNQHWLPAYALFCAFKKKYGTSDYSQWTEISHPTQEQIRDLTSPKSPHYEEVLYHYFVQWNLHSQLKQASDYCASKGVAIKGDIAIGVNPKSADTWVFPELFNLDMSTGAPPDFFAEDGQNWGFPTYNWNAMAKDQYSWWRARLTNMAQYFHLFRIDHILGFFRIWEIPTHAVTGLFGRFNPSVPIHKNELDPELWDTKRLTEPYVRWHLLQQYFGDDADSMAREVFTQSAPGAFKFKPEYDTEKKIYAAFPTVSTPERPLDEPTVRRNETLRRGLFKLVQNVCLLVDRDDPNKFYPRILVQKTSSFQELAAHEKNKMIHLYNDYFFVRQEKLWAAAGFQRLPIMVNTTSMLCCGEDLGMVPACVDPVLKALGILGLRIQRMPSDIKKEFETPDTYPYLTVCTPSCHDTSTVRGWWEEDRNTTQRFYNNVLGLGGRAPDFADANISKLIVRQHLQARSMWAVFPIQDLLGLETKYFAGMNPTEEKINEPSIAQWYWRYRLHVNLEDLVQDKAFSSEIHGLLQASGRLG